MGRVEVLLSHHNEEVSTRKQLNDNKREMEKELVLLCKAYHEQATKEAAAAAAHAQATKESAAATAAAARSPKFAPVPRRRSAQSREETWTFECLSEKLNGLREREKELELRLRYFSREICRDLDHFIAAEQDGTPLPAEAARFIPSYASYINNSH